MSRRLVAAAPDGTIDKAAARMIQAGVGRLPVCEGERPVGIVTRSDLLKALVAGA